MNSRLFGILLVAVIIRILFAFLHPQIIFSSDSYEYQTYAENIATSPSLKLLIQPYRTPVYPLIILLSTYIGSVMVLQFLMGISSILLFYRLCKRLQVPFRDVMTLVVATYIPFIAWEHVLLTETSAILFVLLFVSVFIEQYIKPKTSSVIALAILTVLGFYLRPALILFTGLSLLALLIVQKKRVQLLLAMSFVVFVLVSHSFINKALWGYSGLSFISDTNLFGKILEYDLSIESGKNYPFFYENLRDYRARNGEPSPYRFFDRYDPAISVNMSRLAQMRAFTLTVLLHNLPMFMIKSILSVPRALSEISVLIRPMIPGALISLYQVFQGMTILTLPFLLFGKHRKILSLLGGISLIYVYSMIVLGYEDWGRLIVEVMPLLFIVLVVLGRDFLADIRHRYGGGRRTYNGREV